MSKSTKHLSKDSRKVKRQFLKVYPDLDRTDNGADAPVPDRLFQRRKSQWLVRRLKLSQTIGLLLWLNRNEALSSGGKERLLYLQSKAPISAIEAGLEFLLRLDREVKLQSDFRPQMVELNRRPQSKRFRRYEVSRIGVGYRDKGTLPSQSSSARKRADQEGFVFLIDLPSKVVVRLFQLYPSSIEGDWLDLKDLGHLLKEDDLSPDSLPDLLCF